VNGTLAHGSRRSNRRSLLRQPVAALLGVVAAFALGLAPLVTVAPNRLVLGEGIRVDALAGTAPGLVTLLTVLPFAALALAAVLPARRWVHAAVAVAATLGIAGLLWTAGAEARHLLGTAGSALSRVSLGSGFWILILVAGLAASDAIRRLAPPAPWRVVAPILVATPVVLMLANGQLDALSLLQEHANRREAFDAALWQHLQIVGAGLLPALVGGVLLGLAAVRWPAFEAPMLAILNILQTVPSIALFALLIAPFGIGLVPAGMALALYALLPVVHGVISGLAQVPAAVVDAARGLGMTDQQRLWRVQVPLALPVWLAALRVTTVQVIGLAVVAALIGAGGFGSLVFQGVSSSAMDLVLLGVLPVVALAVAADSALGLLAAWAAWETR
jgi:osmoprotectant transport system permease protein